MNIKTKYSLGDTVWKITRNKPKVWIPCSFCGGSEKYQGNFAESTTVTGKDGTTKSCPDCHGRGGAHEYLELEWMVNTKLTIGQVKAVISDDKEEESYMAFETGVGSGSIHYVDTLCPSKEKAQRECERRNKETT